MRIRYKEAYAEVEGRLDAARAEVFQGVDGMKQLPREFGVRWVPRGGEWAVSIAWVHGTAVLGDGSVGRRGRWARYAGSAVSVMPKWLGQIAQAGPLGAFAVVESMHGVELSVWS